MLIYQLLTILLTFSLPFLSEQFVNISIKSSIIVYAIMLLPVFFRAFLEDIKRKFIPSILFAVFLMTSTISTIFSTNLDQSVMQLLLFYSYFIIFVSIRLIFPSLKDKEIFIYSFLLLIFVLSLISSYNTLIRQFVDKRFLNFIWVYRGHNHLSALLVFAIPLILNFLNKYWHRKRGRIILLLIVCFLIVSLLLTFSIGGMLSLAISFLLVLILFRQTTFSKKFLLKKAYLTVFLIITFLSISSFFLFSETKGLKTLNFQKNPQTHLKARLIYSQAAYDNFLKNPLYGSGLETFQDVFAKIGDKGGAARTSHAHNFFIQMLTDGGIFVFLTSIMLISSILFLAAKKAFEIKNFLYVALFSGLLSSSIFSMIDLDWHVPMVFLYFWIFAALSTNYAE